MDNNNPQGGDQGGMQMPNPTPPAEPTAPEAPAPEAPAEGPGDGTPAPTA